MPLSSVADLIPHWITMLASPLALLVGALVVVSLRSGSPHVIWSRLWTFAAGKSRGKSSEGQLRKILLERQNLLEFRVQTGIRARTTAHALSIADWAEQQGEDLEDVGRCRGFFDVDAVKLKEPLNPWFEFFFIALAVGVLLVYLWIAPLAIAPRVWMILPKGTWVTYGAKDVLVFGTHQRLAKDDCSGESIDKSLRNYGVTEQADLRDACQALRDSRYPGLLNDALRGQRVASVSIAIGAAPLAYLVHYVCAGAMAVRSMTKRIQVRQGRSKGRRWFRRLCCRTRALMRRATRSHRARVNRNKIL